MLHENSRGHVCSSAAAAWMQTWPNPACMCGDTCVDMPADLCVDKCVDMCTKMHVEMYVDVYINMCAPAATHGHTVLQVGPGAAGGPSLVLQFINST